MIFRINSTKYCACLNYEIVTFEFYQFYQDLLMYTRNFLDSRVSGFFVYLNI